MKTFTRFFVLLCPAFSLLLIVPALAQKSSINNDKERLVEQCIYLWSHHKIDIVDSIFTEDCTYEDVAAKKLFKGRNEVKSFLKDNFIAFPDFKVELTSLIPSKNFIACEWIMSGTHTGDYPGLPATGRTFSVRGASVVLIENGKIKKWKDYYDMLDFLQQLGVYKKSKNKN